jgi:hypothetical protein
LNACYYLVAATCICACLSARAAELTLADSPGAGDLSLAGGLPAAQFRTDTPWRHLVAP